MKPPMISVETLIEQLQLVLDDLRAIMKDPKIEKPADESLESLLNHYKIVCGEYFLAERRAEEAEKKEQKDGN